MSEPSITNSIILEVLKTVLSLLVALITLVLAWFVGNRLSVEWNLIQKKRETDITNIQQFYSLYGEFKEISKIWRVIKRNKDSNLEPTPNSRWSLLARSCEIESKNEAILVKLATERHLDKDALKTLGLFRQALQELRESIDDNVEIPAASRGFEYDFFNDLTAKVGLIISSSNLVETLDRERAGDQLQAIANVRSPCYKAEIKSFEETHPQCACKET